MQFVFKISLLIPLHTQMHAHEMLIIPLMQLRCVNHENFNNFS